MSNEKIRKRLGKIHIDKIADNHPLLAAVSAWEGEKKKENGKGRAKRRREIRQRSSLSQPLHFTPSLQA